MTQPRYQHAATLLLNGRVLIAGGYAELLPTFTEPPPPNTVFPQPKRHISAEIFDPETGTSSPTGDMTVGRYSDNGILLPDGRVLIVPGYGHLPIEMYDPHSGRFDVVAHVPSNAMISTATLLPSGRVFVTAMEHTGVFDPDARAFTSIFAMDHRRRLHTASLMKDGRVLIVGGIRGGIEDGMVGRNLIYDPSSKAFAEAGNLQFDRLFHKAVLLQDGRVLIIGGIAGEGPFVPTAEMYDPETNAFSPAGVSAIDPSAALLLPSGKVLLIRSINGDIVLYDPAAHEFFSYRAQHRVAVAAYGNSAYRRPRDGCRWIEGQGEFHSRRTCVRRGDHGSGTDIHALNAHVRPHAEGRREAEDVSEQMCYRGFPAYGHPNRREILRLRSECHAFQ